MKKALDLFFTQKRLENLRNFSLEQTSRFFSEEWFLGTTSDTWVPYLERDIEKARFALPHGKVCYLANDCFRIDLEIGDYFQGAKKNNSSVPFSELVNRISDTAICDQKRQDIKGAFILASNIKLLNMSDNVAIESLNDYWNQALNNGDFKDYVRWLINGPRPNIYKPSCLFAERLFRSDFNGIIYKPGTIVTDILGPCNDAMVVLFQPQDNRNLFHNYHAQ